MLENLKNKNAVWWSYFKEPLFAALFAFLLAAAVGKEPITKFVERFVPVFVGVPALLFTFSLQLRSSIVSGISGDFAGWLQYKKSDLYYLTAALYTVWSGFVVILLCPILVATKPPYWGPMVLGLLSLSVVQTFNLSRTSFEVHSLRTTFERDMKKEALQGKDPK
ncbi:MAG: hypothetical protein PWP23_1537 [Candidatus Sumerlaeota bacterium]|nr:hypothetical protein [Candidatus Sumerlaeota bacterium]